MTGPEHYVVAEKMLGFAEARDAEDRGDATDISLMAEAQVHATLALAAATTVPDYAAWRHVAGVRKTDAASDHARSETANAHPHPNH